MCERPLSNPQFWGFLGSTLFILIFMKVKKIINPLLGPKAFKNPISISAIVFIVCKWTKIMSKVKSLFLYKQYTKRKKTTYLGFLVIYICTYNIKVHNYVFNIWSRQCWRPLLDSKIILMQIYDFLKVKIGSVKLCLRK